MEKIIFTNKTFTCVGIFITIFYDKLKRIRNIENRIGLVCTFFNFINYKKGLKLVGLQKTKIF